MIDLVVETAQEIAETNMLKERGLQIDGGAEVETAIIETGEMTPTIGHDDPRRTLLTRGPVVEVKTAVENPQIEPRMPNLQKYVNSINALSSVRIWLMF
jgi:hypothetical protein